MKSKLFTGFVEHARLSPVRHEFRYPVYVYGLDLDELAALDKRLPLFGYNRFRPAALHDADYLDAGQGSVKEKLMRFLAGRGIADGVSSVFLITSARYFNHAFNPVSFYYCLDDAGRVIRMAAEVNNTFGERHLYFPEKRDGGGAYFAQKAFHVSPFNNLMGEYEFWFSPPDADLDIRIRLVREGEEVFSARLTGTSAPLTATGHLKTLLRHPLLPHLTIPRIFAQAARLYFFKKMAYHPKPEPTSPMTIKKTKTRA